jgi:hypothetical protein
MPTPEQAIATQVTTGTGSARGQMSRRSVLRGAAGASAAALAGAALTGAPALAADRALQPATSARRRASQLSATEQTASEAVVVHVRDLRTGQLDVYRGTNHVRIRDRQLAAQLARVSR